VAVTVTPLLCVRARGKVAGAREAPPASRPRPDEHVRGGGGHSCIYIPCARRDEPSALAHRAGPRLRLRARGHPSGTNAEAAATTPKWLEAAGGSGIVGGFTSLHHEGGGRAGTHDRGLDLSGTRPTHRDRSRGDPRRASIDPHPRVPAGRHVHTALIQGSDVPRTGYRSPRRTMAPWQRHQERLGVVRQDGHNGSQESRARERVVPQLSLPPTSSLTVMPAGGAGSHTLMLGP
jgi:hypothetical protein